MILCDYIHSFWFQLYIIFAKIAIIVGPIMIAYWVWKGPTCGGGGKTLNF